MVKGGTGNKAMVLGAVQRSGKVRTKVIPKTDSHNVVSTVTSFVQPDSIMVTDEPMLIKNLVLIIPTKQLITGIKNM